MGPKAGKVSVHPFQRVAGSRGRAPVAPHRERNALPEGAKCFSGGSIFLCFFLFAIEKERRKPSALHRGRHPGRGAAGLLVTNGGSRLELKSPTGRCQGAARAAHPKHPGGMFWRVRKRAKYPCPKGLEFSPKVCYSYNINTEAAGGPSPRKKPDLCVKEWSI